ncbi:MAG: hypothetical protein SGJ26_13470 [Nitrospirota bacterium]|nr:hypothetical protein [Nitrospirota bacterium]
MSQVSDKIMQVVSRSPGCLLEEVMLECPGLTWNQVFCEIDRMSRSGQVRLTAKGPWLYAVTSTTPYSGPMPA